MSQRLSCSSMHNGNGPGKILCQDGKAEGLSCPLDTAQQTTTLKKRCCLMEKHRYENHLQCFCLFLEFLLSVCVRSKP